MKKQIEDHIRFHKTFGHPVAEKPCLIPMDRVRLRYDLMKEENEEYFEAATAHDLVGVADSLTDKLVILLGTVVEHGLQDVLLEAWDEVVRSNMSKLGEDNRPIFREDGKIMKGPNYFPPDLEAILARHMEGSDGS